MKKTPFGMLPADVLDRRDLTPGAKILLQVMNMESYQAGSVRKSDTTYAEKSGLSRGQIVYMRRQLEDSGLIEKDGPPEKQIQGYRFTHSDMSCAGAPVEPAPQVVPPTSRRLCPTCRRPKKLNKAGYCYQCVAEAALEWKIRDAKNTLGPDATAQEIAIHLKMEKFVKKIKRILAA